MHDRNPSKLSVRFSHDKTRRSILTHWSSEHPAHAVARILVEEIRMRGRGCLIKGRESIIGLE